VLLKYRFSWNKWPKFLHSKVHNMNIKRLLQGCIKVTTGKRNLSYFLSV